MMKRLNQRCESGRDKNEDLYAIGFDTLVKRWGMCINVGGGYEEIKVYPRFKYHEPFKVPGIMEMGDTSRIPNL
jgi:hypothetical protein